MPTSRPADAARLSAPEHEAPVSIGGLIRAIAGRSPRPAVVGEWSGASTSKVSPFAGRLPLLRGQSSPLGRHRRHQPCGIVVDLPSGGFG